MLEYAYFCILLPVEKVSCKNYCFSKVIDPMINIFGGYVGALRNNLEYSKLVLNFFRVL